MIYDKKKKNENVYFCSFYPGRGNWTCFHIDACKRAVFRPSTPPVPLHKFPQYGPIGSVFRSAAVSPTTRPIIVRR